MHINLVPNVLNALGLWRCMVRRHIATAEALAKALEMHTALTDIDITLGNKSQVGEMGVRVIAEALGKLPNLQELQLNLFQNSRTSAHMNFWYSDVKHIHSETSLFFFNTLTDILNIFYSSSSSVCSEKSLLSQGYPKHVDS